MPSPDNARVLFSERAYLSGATVQLDIDAGETGAILIELHAADGDARQPLRSATIQLAAMEPGEAEHVYWNPVAASKGASFVIRATRVADGVPYLADRELLLEAKPIHSQPQGYEPLPQALLFSPVSQCNLNCTHCISRPTRARLRFASDATWEAVAQVARGEKFVDLATDYSGDILFDERRYPGTLQRLIALEAKFRVSTHANCLDDDIVDMLLGSQVYDLNFSIDSMDPEIYRTIRRGSIPLAEVLAKIARFMGRKRAAGKEIHTSLSFALMRSNAASIKPALAFAREHGIDHVIVVPVLAFTEDMLEEIFVWDEAAYASLHAELTAEAVRVGVALVMQSPVTKWRDEDIHAPCEVPWGTAAITANGDVMACCMPGTVIGNLNEQSLKEIWTGPAFATFRMRVNSTDPPASCRNCGMSRVANNRRAYAPVQYAQPPPAAAAVPATASATSAGSLAARGASPTWWRQGLLPFRRIFAKSHNGAAAAS